MRKWAIRIILGILRFILALVLVISIAFRIVNRSNGSLLSSGENRKYLLHVPERYDPSVPTPLVISIHGFAEWPAHQMEISRWNDLADQNGFIVVYPMGTKFPLRWRTYGAPGSATDPVRDVTFISELIDTIGQNYNIDSARIYANGLSNGGGMSFVLSCQLSDRIAATGLVAGAYVYPWEACHPTRPVPAIVFHGTADPIVPFRGGPSRSFDIPFPDINEWVRQFADHNQCASTPRALASNGDVSGIEYTDCAADLVFYTIEGGGHTWPGGKALPEFITGRTSYDIDATKTMWEFFQQHPFRE